MDKMNGQNEKNETEWFFPQSFASTAQVSLFFKKMAPRTMAAWRLGGGPDLPHLSREVHTDPPGGGATWPPPKGAKFFFLRFAPKFLEHF